MLKKIIRNNRFSRLIAVTVSLAILCLAISTAALTSVLINRTMERYFIEQGEQIAETFAQQSLLAVLYQTAENATKPMDTMLSYPDVVMVKLTDSSGYPIAEKFKQGERFTFPTPTAPPSIESAMLVSENSEYWTFVAPVRPEPKDDSPFNPFEMSQQDPETRGLAFVIHSKRTLNRLVMSLVIGIIFITLTIAVVTILALRALVRQLSRPLYELSNLMSTAEHGPDEVRARLEGPRDIVDMSASFNFMMDRLEERKAELQHSRDEALKTAMLKSQFAAMISHEVRTPLNGIVGMLDILHQMDLPKKPKEYIDVAWESARALADLTNDVLDISKLEAGKLELQVQDFELHKLIEEVINLFSKQAQQKGVQLAYSLSPAVPDRIRSDGLRLRQVLHNLVGNAVKFTARGSITVKVTCKIKPTGEYELNFVVADTGIGISTEDQQRIFQPYSQAHSDTARQYGGTGLGLALCRQLVALLGGEIGVTSTPMVGSRFWFTARCADAAALTTTTIDPIFPGKKALIVEENEVVREFLETTLTRLDIRCRSFAFGETALAELRTADRKLEVYDVVIINSGATDGAGADLERRIREESWARAPALLLLDIHAAPFSVSAFENGIVLGKPLSQDRVVSALTKLLSSDADDFRDRQDEEASTSHIRKPRVLVVEDNRANQRVVEAMLTAEGFDCSVACNGREAIDAIKHRTFDLVLMDCSMPVMDGYEATAHIRTYESDIGRRTPVIALTANTDINQTQRCLDAGMDDYLSKPITYSDLKIALQRWCCSDATANGQERLPAPNHDPIPTDGPIDFAVFDRLRGFLGPALGTMCRHFVEDMHDYIDQVESAIKEARLRDVCSIAHAIRGSASNVGANELARLARSIDEDIAGGDTAELPKRIVALRDALHSAAAVLPQDAVTTRLATDQTPNSFRILIVDDDRSTRSAIRHVLQQDGFEIDEAINGTDALRYLQTRRPDAILMDAVMPEMDGFTTCSRIAQMTATRDVPVLMITALDDKMNIERAFSAGACDYITKPIHFAVLSQRVRRIIRGAHAERRVRDLVTNDPLTGLPNRAIFFQKLEEQLAGFPERSAPLAVYILNVDRFKSINDTFGHAAGDTVLQEIALRIGTEGFDCVARLGGDEFGMFRLEFEDAADIAASTQRLCTVLRAPFNADQYDVHVDVSIGVSVYPADASAPSGLLKCADLAMQRAKKQRSGFQFYDASMEMLVSESVRTEHDLRIAAQRGNLEVYYQPQIDICTGVPVAVEALLRWHHPTRGIVLPAEFIPLAEQSGMILPIGRQVLQTVCEQLVQWKEMGVPIERASVNLSRVQILHPNFLTELETLLETTGCKSTWLEFELTEDLFFEQPVVPESILHALRGHGIRLCIDDFGTGSRALSYLKSLPVTTVKIDRTFVQDLPPEDDEMEIVSHIVNVAHALGVTVVAEGVETEFQETFLRDVECDLLQGFRFHNAIPATEVAQVFATAQSATSKL